jgi:dTMP kinase
MTKAGRLIVIDGTDGSGKKTQIALLEKHLKEQGYEVEKIDFPQYGHKSAGLVEEYLNGDYGQANEVTPYQGSLFYALDRYAASFTMKKWLAEGKVVLCDRYVSANMGHQA